MELFQEYEWREMLHDATEGARDAFNGEPLKAYIGFDPSASSLHVGHLLQVMALVHLQRAGHTPIALVGGGTGLIGDPSGKDEERPLLTKDEARFNGEAMGRQLERFLDFDAKANPAVMVNNLDWLGPMTHLDFLRDVGKHFSVNQMLRKESVRRRLKDEESGISYTEFSYLLLQAYDFLALHDRLGCTAQMGGSDQWGNITAGIDLVRRVRGEKAYGAVFHLITSSSGKKFGKTEAGTVWLDPNRTSPFRFYQFWINTEDGDVVRYLKFFTLMGPDEITPLEEQAEGEPHRREAQRALAEDVTRRVHGEDGLARAVKATDVLFGGDEIEGLEGDEIADIFSDVPSSEVPRSKLEGGGLSMVDLLAGSGVASSKGDARRSIEGGGVYLNNRRVQDVSATATAADAVDGRFLVLRKGRKSYHLVEVRG